MTKLIVLTSLVIATDVPPMLEGAWDAVSAGRHVADVNVAGGRAAFDDGSSDGPYEYQIHVKHGLLEMNGWVARAGSKPSRILWHKDNKEVMWKRQAHKKHRGNTLEQSHSGLSRTVLPEDNTTSSAATFADLLKESEAAQQEHARRVRAEHHPEPVEAKAEPEAKEQPRFMAPAPKRDASENVTKHALAAQAPEPKLQKVRKVRKVVSHSLSQALVDKYIAPIQVARSQEKNETIPKNQNKEGKNKRRKVFPAAMHSLAALMTNTQKGIDEDAFDDVIETVRQIIRDEAAATCTNIEGELQTRADAITECGTLHGYSSGAADGTSFTYDEADNEYATAVSEYETAWGDENVTCTERDTACSNRDAKGQELYNEVTGSSSCALPETPEDTVTYDDSFVLADVDTWANGLITKHTAWDTAKIECTTKEQECSEKETITAEKDTIKTEKCTTLETAATDGLSAYDTCYNTAAGEFAGYSADDQINSIKNSIEAVETLMCYIDVAMEGLAGDADSRVASGDSAITSCEMDGDDFVCNCADANGSRYDEPYNLGLNIPDAPDRDDGWDGLGCAEAAAP